MLKIINKYSRYCTSGVLLHHCARINQNFLPDRLFHQTISLYDIDDGESKNSSNKSDKNKRFDRKNNSRHLKLNSSDNVVNAKKENTSDRSSIYDLFDGLKVDCRGGKKKRVIKNKRPVVTIRKDQTKFVSGRDQYLREALAECRTNRKIMPKEDKYHLEPFRQLKAKKRQRDQMKGVPHNAYFQVVGNGSPGGGKSLILYTDLSKYMFNCGEGTQRLSLEYSGHGTLSNMTDVFITNNSWENLGGLPGMLLSIRGSGAPDIKIHGPPGISELYETVKTFIVLHDFDVMFKSNSDVFEDQAIKVHNVSLKPYDDEGLTESLIIPSKTKHTLWLPDVIIGQAKTGEYLVNAAYETTLSDRQGFNKPRDSAITAYSIEFKPKPGKLLIEKCVELGVPPGPLYGELKAGREVTLDSGRVVMPSEVLDDASPPSRFIIIECPSEKYLFSLKNAESLSANYDENKDYLQAIFHFTPSHVVATSGYKEWMNSFKSEVQHIFLNDWTQGYGTHGIQGFNFRMNNLNPHIMPLISTNQAPSTTQETGESIQDLDESYKEFKSEINGRTSLATLAQKIHVRPNAGLIEEHCGDIIKAEENELEISNLPLYSQEIIKTNKQKHVNLRLNSQLLPSKDDHEYPKVTFLGTGSSVPSKYRNVTSILIESHPNQFIILDCGEGTVFQLHRMYGRSRAKEILRQLTAIYISHQHADHQLGLIRIIQEREKAFKEVEQQVKLLYLIAPSRMSHFLCMYHAKFEDILTDLCQIRNEHLLPFTPSAQEHNNFSHLVSDLSTTKPETRSPFKDKNPYSNQAVSVKNDSITTQKIYPSVLNQLTKVIGLKSIKTCRALHCPGAFCVSFVFNYETDAREFKLVYTGDTRPTEQLVELASEADLFIHEATLEHHMIRDCKIKKHSTFTEAIECSKKANARFTIFTHFSQRYAKFPIFDEFENEENIGWAWDFMTVCPSTFKYFNSFYSSVNERFPEELKEMLIRKEDFQARNEKSIEDKISNQLGLNLDNVEESNKTRKRRISKELDASDIL